MCLTCFAFFLNVYRHASDTFDDEPHACFQFQEQRFQEYNHKHNSNAENKLGFVSKICNQTKKCHNILRSLGNWLDYLPPNIFISLSDLNLKSVQEIRWIFILSWRYINKKLNYLENAYVDKILKLIA